MIVNNIVNYYAVENAVLLGLIVSYLEPIVEMCCRRLKT